VEQAVTYKAAGEQLNVFRFDFFQQFGDYWEMQSGSESVISYAFAAA